MRVIGLHAHTGSGVFTIQNWSETAIQLAQIAQRFKDVKFVNLGGGLGVPEKSDQPPLDLRAQPRP